MRVALLTTFAASKKEPLAAMMDRIHKAFLDAGLGEPASGGAAGYGSGRRAGTEEAGARGGVQADGIYLPG